jgi:DNA-binding NarL/FixJ family response regulator
MKLLIVDDNSAIRSMIKWICKDQFTEINECEDGDDAVKAYEQQLPDWVLMDIKMKRMDGIEAAREIKAKFPDARIIMVSQFNDERIIEASMKLGAKEFVSKEDLPKIKEIIRRNNK